MSNSERDNRLFEVLQDSLDHQIERIRAAHEVIIAKGDVLGMVCAERLIREAQALLELGDSVQTTILNRTEPSELDYLDEPMDYISDDETDDGMHREVSEVIWTILIMFSLVRKYLLSVVEQPHQ